VQRLILSLPLDETFLQKDLKGTLIVEYIV